MYYHFRVKKQVMNRIAAGVLIGLILTIIFFFLLAPDFHHAKAANPQVLRFESVSIHSNDTLWSIAKDYYSKEYGSVNDYVKEIKRCNSLTSDHIRSGTSIIVPIYIADKK